MSNSAPPPEVIPHNIEAEQAVLGAALVDNAAMATLPAPEDFYREAHQDIAGAMHALHRAGEFVDLITVTNHLRANEQLSDATGPAYLDSLISLVQSAAHAGSYARIVVERAAERRLATLCFRTYEALLEGKPIGRVFPTLLQQLGGMQVPGRRRPIELHDALEGLADDIDSGKTAERIFTGFYRFDRMTEGFQRQTVNFVGGDPGMGKTAWAMQVLDHISESFGSVGIISQEMGNRKLAGRNAAQQTGVGIRQLPSETVRAVAQAASQRRYGFTIYDWQMTIAEMCSTMRNLKAKRKDLVCVAIDHAQLIARDENQHRLKDHELMAVLCPVLRGLAQELDIVIFVLCQLSREARKRAPGERPAMTDFLGGSAIEMTADIALILWSEHRPEDRPDDPTIPIEVLAGIVKNRDGVDGDVRLHFTRATTTFADYDARAQGQRRPATPPPPPRRHLGTRPEDDFEDVPI